MAAEPIYTPAQMDRIRQYQAQMAQYAAAPQVTMQHNPYYHQAPAAGPAYTYTRRRQSIKVHLLLAFTTMGLGNVLYARWCNSNVAARYQWKG